MCCLAYGGADKGKVELVEYFLEIVLQKVF